MQNDYDQYKAGTDPAKSDYYAALEKQLKAFIVVGFGELAATVKKDFLRDRDELRKQNNELIDLRARLEQLEERFDMVNGGQAGRGLTP